MKKNDIMNKKNHLRYAICVDFECMNDQGYTKEEALAWFKTEECTEAYDGTIIDGIYKPTGENFLDVVEEVYHGMEHGNDAMDWFIKTLQAYEFITI